jgi:hypothetical protein
MTCNPVDSIDARWRCAIPGCSSPDWTGAVVSWPSWAAYSTNIRAGYNSRVVYSTSGQMLYPYMGAWADGCRITPTSGQVLVIEWQRGTDVWRETYVNPGETYTIDLVGSENGAMLEANAWGGNFRVSISNCTPQPVV